MARIAVLNNEQVFILRNLGTKTLKEYAVEFKASIPTLIAAKKGRGVYENWNISKEEEDALVKKYFHG